MSGMEDVPKKAKFRAFERVLERYDTSGMSAEEKCEVLTDNKESINQHLKEMGYADEVESADMEKTGNPHDMLKSFYNRNPSQTTTVNQELASDIEEKFKVQDVDTVDLSESASLGVFYGGEVESQASSNRGNAAHSSGNQAE